MGKRITAWLLFTALFLPVSIPIHNVQARVLFTGETVDSREEESEDEQEEKGLIQSPYGVLMEASTGEILYEKQKDTKRSPASITKIMTLILIFDAIENGSLNMDDMVTTSAYAKSMGGSQVYLEEGETQDVETMIKCIVIASGNDASVAMAEHIAGSEEEFVKKMNDRAQSLGMKNTHFEDCCGLTDSENHYTTAYDVALMSRELITHYPKILEYSSIWMDTITHKTRQGTSEFGLTNTNKLIRSYEGCVGLKTGSTSLAKYCVSAVAQKNGMSLISVVMAAPDYKVRFSDAAAMFNYGFAKCSLYQEPNPDRTFQLKVLRGKESQVRGEYGKAFSYLDTSGRSLDKITQKTKLKELTAPVKKGDTVGKTVYYLEGEKIGEASILAAKTVEKAEYQDCLKEVSQWWYRREAARE